MATAPFPFPYPAPVPAYGLPPAFASPHHTQIHGYCYPPAFPYAAADPYTHPAAAYAPPPSFFPAPSFGYPPAPAIPSPVPTQIAYHYPLDPIPVLPNPQNQVHAPPPELTSPINAAPATTGASANFTSPDPTTPSPTSTPHVGSTSSKAACAPVTNKVGPYLACDAAVQAVADERVPAKDVIRHQLRHELLNIHARLDQQQARERTTFDSIKGELANLTAMASHLAVSLGKQLSFPHKNKPEHSQHFPFVQHPSSRTCTNTITQPSAALGSSSWGITGTASVAPKVFGEMPTPISLQETHCTAPDYCSGHHNPIQNSCVSNLSEQNLYGMPQSYGFSNLNRQSIILADGTKRSYFTLPEDYPSKQATDGIFSSANEKKSDTELLAVCSNNASDNAFNEEAIDLTFPHAPVIHADRSIKFKGMHVSDVSEEEKQGNDQLLKCFSKATETGQTSACLSYNSDIFDCTLEQQHQINEKASVNVQQLRNPPWNVMGIDETRNEWDPGDHTILSSTLNKNIFGVPTRVPQQSCYYRVPSNQEIHGIQFLWDPGILSLKDMMLGKTAVPHQVQFVTKLSPSSSETCIQYYAPNGVNSAPHGNSFVLQRVTQSSQDNYFCSLHYKTEYSHMSCLWEFSICSPKRVQWDPGIGSLLFLYIWLHVQMIQLVHCSAIHACYLVSALLPLTQFAVKDSSNIEVGELITRCLVCQPLQITKWTSTTSNGITSSKYAYTMDFLIQWVFFYQQGVHDYNAENLLSSHNYLLICEMDIIFITFLPP